MANLRALVFVLSASVAVVVRADDASDSGLLFRDRIASLLQARCLSCHNDTDKKGGLTLQTAEGFRAGGDDGRVYVAGKADESRIVELVTPKEGVAEMPKDADPLSASEVAAIRDWVSRGAIWPAEMRLERQQSRSSDWWSLRPVMDRGLTAIAIAGEERIGNPIDAFVDAKLLEQGLKLSPPADPRTLFRRVYFDLVGLPPSPDEIEEFLRDSGPLAYERLVDRLLASPRYGERWARHWLDVVRFAESDGFEKNLIRPNAWPYRDYVIAAFNDDKPYDRFVLEQIAGDQLGADAATGYLVGGPWDEVASPDPVLTAQQRADELHDMVSTTGSAFLGLTVGCARCHSHKFDPIPQSDYYALKACLEGVRMGERALRPPDHLDRLARAEVLKEELRTIERDLWDFQPLAYIGRVVMLDDAAPAQPGGLSVSELIPSSGVEPHAPGETPGEASYLGTVADLPNLGRSYRWWDKPAGRDLFAWMPRVAGTFRIWLSWGCGWSTHAADARFILDRDGDLETRDDQIEIASVDERRPAGGTGEPRERPLWSGFYLAGQFELNTVSKLVLRGGDTNAPVTADVVAFEEVVALSGDSPRAGNGPHVRPRATRGENVERFTPQDARYVRMSITATTDVEPCIDELEVFTAEPSPRNVALASTGAKATASGTFPNSEIHRLEHVHDGQYGNGRSWISNEIGRGWVQIELPKVERIDRVLWSRDRGEPPKYEDRTASDYVVEVSLDGVDWHVVAGSRDRLRRDYPAKVDSIRTMWGLSGDEAARFENLASRKKELSDRIRELTAVPTAYVGRFETPKPTRRFHRGDPMQPREEVAAGALSAFGPAFVATTASAEGDRRLALARWIACSENPLTARVIVNRLWHYHFGRGIVDTPSDFGANGGQPTHPELLDFLAAELVGRQWSLKAIQRLIVTSAAYRQSSQNNAAARLADADNRYLWRYPPRRMEAETLRDTILATTGSLDLAMGGPGFDLFEPNSNYVKVYNTKRDFGPDTFRRMIYQTKPRMQLDDTFGAFDCPDGGQIAPSRGRSTTPLQALNLLNSPFLLQQSQILADRVRRESGPSIETQVRRVFELVFGRAPSVDESRAGEALVREHGLAMLCRTLFNANEFVMVY